MGGAVRPSCRRDPGAAEAAAAIERRRRGLEHLAGITDVLSDVEQRAEELNRRAAELVQGWL
jgi:hypothetical protein